MKSLATDGHTVTLATENPIDGEAVRWLGGISVEVLNSGDTDSTEKRDVRSWFKRRLSNYWGYRSPIHQKLTEIANRKNVDAMVAVGCESLPYLRSELPIPKIWYPADDPTLHAVSLVKQRGVSLSSIREAVINVAYQRAFRGVLDTAWVVSPRDRQWMRRTSGFQQVDVIPNGVDAEHYSPCVIDQEPDSCIFWGRLDFAPNVGAVEWFLDHVWPNVLSHRPTASFHVCGSHPVPSLQGRMNEVQGVQFHENLDDLRPKINQMAVAVFPMVSGAGVKNKVLEAAAMGKPICATQRCLNGLSTQIKPPLHLAETPNEWLANLLNLWNDSNERRRSGEEARRWVQQQHSWKRSALAAIQSIESLSN